MMSEMERTRLERIIRVMARKASRETMQVISMVKKTSISELEFIPYAFYGIDVFVTQLFAQLPDVNIDGPVAYDHITAPDSVQDLLTCEYLAGLGSQQGQQLKFFTRQAEFFRVFFHQVFFPVDPESTYFQYSGFIFFCCPA